MKLRKQSETGNKSGKPGKPPGARWTPKMNSFCDGLARNMNQTDAARYAGYKKAAHEGVRLMKNPLVIQWLAHHKKMRRKATQNALNEQALGSVATPREVEETLTAILTKGKNESARVAAAMAIARINGWIMKPDPLTDRLKGKSPDELEFIALNGRDPADAQELQAFIENGTALKLGHYLENLRKKETKGSPVQQGAPENPRECPSNAQEIEGNPHFGQNI